MSDPSTSSDGAGFTRRDLLLRGGAGGAALLALGTVTPGRFSWASAAAAGQAAGTLVIGDRGVPDALDPDGTNTQFIPNLTAVESILDPLLAINRRPNPSALGGGTTIDFAKPYVPMLARSWSVSKSGTVWTFNLRQGVMSSAGNEFTADDVVWSWQRSLAAKRVGSFIWSVNAKVKSMRAVDPHTLEITTNGPAPMLLPSLSAVQAIWPLDSTEAKKHVTAKDKNADAWLADNAPGFGPYKVGDWTKGQSQTLVARDDYWGVKPSFSQVKLIALPSAANRVTTIERGDIDVALALPQQSVEAASKDKKLHVYQFRGNSQVWVFPNLKVTELRNPLVRQALWYAMPVDEIIKRVYFGRADVAKTLMPTFLPYATGRYWHYQMNPAKAKALLKKAGYGDGFSIDFYYASESEQLDPIAAILQQAWNEIGVKVSLKKGPESTLVARVFAKKDLPLYMSETASPVVPDGGILGVIFVTNGFANVSNYTNKTFDRLNTAAQATLAAGKRKAIFAQMQHVLAEDPAILPVVSYRETAVARTSAVSSYGWFPTHGTHVQFIKGV